MQIELKILNKEFYAEYDLPKYATAGSAGLDLRACLLEPIALKPADDWYPPCVRILTGIAIHIKDPNVAGFILPRSGLGHTGLVLGNLTGLIDADYQGELILSMWNRSNEPIIISPGDRIAQLVFTPIIRPMFTIVDEFTTTTDRISGGYGSTGLC